MSVQAHRSQPVAMCPIRINEPCLLCASGATGPANCPVVWLVMSDPDLRESLHELRVATLSDVEVG